MNTHLVGHQAGMMENICCGGVLRKELLGELNLWHLLAHVALNGDTVLGSQLPQGQQEGGGARGGKARGYHRSDQWVLGEIDKVI